MESVVRWRARALRGQSQLWVAVLNVATEHHSRSHVRVWKRAGALGVAQIWVARCNRAALPARVITRSDGRYGPRAAGVNALPQASMWQRCNAPRWSATRMYGKINDRFSTIYWRGVVSRSS